MRVSPGNAGPYGNTLPRRQHSLLAKLSMSAPTIEHPSPDLLLAFHAGRLAPDVWEQVAEHVAECDACCATLRQVPDAPFVGRLRAVCAVEQADDRRPEIVEVGAKRLEVPVPLRDHPRYRIVRVLGAGGMGVVFEAEHRLMERKVALKVINPQLTRKSNIVERFLLEVKAAAKLSHPNVVAAHDAEHAGDLLFLVMEYVDGASLDRVVRRHGPLTARHACHYARQVAMGLEQAAERGLVHRDIKPQNLMLNRRGQIKILDFGLARLAREAMGSDLELGLASPDGTQLLYTAAGQVLGTPDYIAPEQVTAPADADSRADIYSLGCTMYFLLTGRPPFPTGSAAEKLDAHVRRSPEKLATLRPDLPTTVVEVVERMMEKDRARRYQTPGEVVAALTKAKAAETSDAPSAFDPQPTPDPQATSDPLYSAEARPASDRVSPFAWDTFADRPANAVASTIHETDPDRTPLMPAGDAWFPSAFGATSRERNWVERTARRYRWPFALIGLCGLLLLAVAMCVRLVDSLRDTGRDVLVVVPPEFTADDLETIRAELAADPGVRVSIASTSRSPCTPLQYGSRSVSAARPVKPELTLAEACERGGYDALVLANGNVYPYKDQGGEHAASIGRLIRETADSGGIVAAIGAGEGVLAQAGFLRGRRVSANAAMRQYMGKGGAEWSSDSVVVDGRLITAAESRDARAFVDQLMRELNRSGRVGGRRRS